VRAFSSSSSSSSGVAVLRDLLADAATRDTVLEALREGIKDKHWDIRQTCERMLKQEGEWKEE